MEKKIQYKGRKIELQNIIQFDCHNIANRILKGMIDLLVWVVYDISSNKIRRNAIKACKNVGLYRVQKSVFLGEIEENDFDELKLKMEDIIDLDKDSVYIFPMSKKGLNQAGLIGQVFDKELVTDEIISKFFDEFDYYITPSELIEFNYCKRFIYYMKCLNIPQFEENRFKVQKGERFTLEKRMKIRSIYVKNLVQ